MPKRKQFKGICHDILDTFISRNNDLDGYWALGKYVSFLEAIGELRLQFKLLESITIPHSPSATLAVEYYRGAVLRMMRANAMPDSWIADATITVSIVAPTKMVCNIEIVSDLGKAYQHERLIHVRAHDPAREYRRGDRFGPSNRHGQ